MPTFNLNPRWIHLIKNVAIIVNIMIMGKKIKVPLRINTMNLVSPTSSFPSINPFSFNSCNLRTIKIILFDLIQGNGVPYLLSKDFASCFAKMTNEINTTNEPSRTIKITMTVFIFFTTKPTNGIYLQHLQRKSQSLWRLQTLKHSNHYLLNQKYYADKRNSPPQQKHYNLNRYSSLWKVHPSHDIAQNKNLLKQRNQTH